MTGFIKRLRHRQVSRPKRPNYAESPIEHWENYRGSMKESDLSVSLGDGSDQNMQRGQNGSPSPGTILVINNLPEQLQLLSSMLRNAGYDVLEAANPKAAFRLAANERPDLIINDFSMSETDGIELCRRLRVRLDLASTPILLLSHFRVDTSNAVAGIEARADHFL